jgi:tetratricopeptide (TPR) repeat protein
MASKTGTSLGDLVTHALQLHKEGDLKGALVAYERVLPRLPGGDMAAKLSSNAGSILMQMGEYERARSMFEAAVAGHPDSAQAHFNLAVVLTSKLNIHDVAMKHCIKAMKLDPNMHKGELFHAFR